MNRSGGGGESPPIKKTKYKRFTNMRMLV